MKSDEVAAFMRMLGIRNVKARGSWVMGSCPFAPWTHQGKTDNNPSFGVSVGSPSFYNCFSCSRSGPAQSLPFSLSMLSKVDYPSAREYIWKHDVYSLPDFDDGGKRRTMVPLHESVVASLFVGIDKVAGLSANTIREWKIMYDERESRIIFQIFDHHGRLVGIRGRYMGTNRNVPKYRTYAELSQSDFDMKACGVWYGMHRRLVPDKAIVVVEGERDLLMLWQTGLVSNVWASMGAKVTTAQIRTLRSENLPVVLFFDDDEAGKEARSSVRAGCHKLVPLYMVSDYHGCKDPAEIVERRVTHQVLQSIKKLP